MRTRRGLYTFMYSIQSASSLWCTQQPKTGVPSFMGLCFLQRLVMRFILMDETSGTQLVFVSVE